MQDYLTPKELSLLLKKSVRTLAEWRITGEGPAYVQIRPGGAILYSRAEVQSWMDQKTIRSTAAMSVKSDPAAKAAR